jgi:hypothetical protein
MDVERRGDTMTKINEINITPERLLKVFTSDDIYKQNFYVILGKQGPTGKTWLATNLKEHGFNVMELSEFIGELVEYNDNNNHIRFDPLDNTVIIVLNKRLERIK